MIIFDFINFKQMSEGDITSLVSEVCNEKEINFIDFRNAWKKKGFKQLLEFNFIKDRFIQLGITEDSLIGGFPDIIVWKGDKATTKPIFIELKASKDDKIRLNQAIFADLFPELECHFVFSINDRQQLFFENTISHTKEWLMTYLDKLKAQAVAIEALVSKLEGKTV